MVSDLIGSCGHLCPILPRSLHRPRASTDGSSTRKANRTGVRLWTACLIGPPEHLTSEGSDPLGRPWRGDPFKERSGVQKNEPSALVNRDLGT